MLVEVLPCAVVAHGRAGVGVAGGNLHVAKVQAGVDRRNGCRFMVSGSRR
jgi:hypothetical protein